MLGRIRHAFDYMKEPDPRTKIAYWREYWTLNKEALIGLRITHAAIMICCRHGVSSRRSCWKLRPVVHLVEFSVAPQVIRCLTRDQVEQCSSLAHAATQNY